MLVCTGLAATAGHAVAQSAPSDTQPAASILPVGPAIAQPSPEAVAAKVKARMQEQANTSNHPLPIVVMRRISDGKQCSFSVLDGTYVNFHEDPYGCEDNIYNTFEIVGAHEGMWIEMEAAPNCNGSESYAKYIVSFGPGHGPVGNIAPTSVAASVGVPVGQILNDGSGKRAFIADGYKSTGTPLPNAVSCVLVRNLLPNGPYHYRNQASGLCLRSDEFRPYPVACTAPVPLAFYELNDYFGEIISADSVATPTKRKYLNTSLSDDVLEFSTTYLPTHAFSYNATSSRLETLLGFCASPSDDPYRVNTHSCRHDTGARMQWIREPAPVR
ncbi:hypothetical protein [Pandoraea anhela]|nr:hypothetical protein [Pandoraea anhela]